VPRSDAPNRALVIGSLLTLWIVWGSTYLALRWALEGFPPMLLNGIRFLFAGGALYLLIRRRFRATRAQMRNSFMAGGLMVFGGVGMVTMAEHHGIGSAVAATAIAVTPVWIGVASGLFGEWPGKREWVGLAIGLAGTVILGMEGDFQASPVGLAYILAAPIIWSFASVWGTKLDVPADPLSNTAVQLTAGGVVMTLVGLLTGESITAMPSARAWWALAYLAIVGSLLAYTAYIYLMHTVRPSLATSYAYVNPVVAVFLGVTLGGEKLSGAIYMAWPLILVAIALVATAPAKQEAPRLEPEPAEQPA
jgi:drug/metabolite transporter (DMT)-like permease